MRIKEIRELIKLLEKSGVGEIEVSEGDYRVRISRGGASPATGVGVHSPAASAETPLQAVAAAAPVAPPIGGIVSAAPEAAAADLVSSDHVLVKSPFVGTFYRSPSPEANPYVEVGDEVKKGQVLCIVEAMKLMNEIESECDGIVRNIYPGNAQPVEFGAPLFELEPR